MPVERIPVEMMPPEMRLARLANAYQLSRAVHLAARLELGRHLAEGPRSAESLADALGLHARTLSRLLGFLAQVGVVEQRSDGQFGPTELSARLDLVDSMAQGEEAWHAWSLLDHAVETGESTFEAAHGSTFYDYAARHPEKAERWHAWSAFSGMAFAPIVADAVAPVLEASSAQNGAPVLVDVGGGSGAILASILRRAPRARGVLFDLADALAGADELLAAAGVGERCRIEAGNAFEGVPARGDVYLVSRVLLGATDADAVRLLEACRRALATGGRLLLVDQLMPEPGDPARPRLAAGDLHAYLLWGGGYRSRAEMAALLARAGLALRSVRSLPAPGGGPDGPDLLEVGSKENS